MPKNTTRSTPKQAPSQLVQDNDGHWYLVAEDDLERFEAAYHLMDSQDDDVLAQGVREMAKIKSIPLDDPSELRILKWESIT